MFKRIVFFVYILLVGLLCTFYIPPFQKADEPTHFLRTDALDKEQIYCNVDNDKKEGYFFVSKSIKNYIGYHDKERMAFNVNQKYFNVDHPKYKDNNLENEKLRDLCSFGFIGYLPNLIGYKTGSLISGGNLDVIFYAGRFLPFLMYFFLVVFLSQRIKSYFIRNIFYFYSALPMVIHQVTSYSYDTLMLILTLVFLFYLDKIFSKYNFKIKDKILFGLSLFLIATSKPGYYPFWINIFLLPNFFNKKNFKKEFLIRMLVFLIGVGLIFLFTYSHLPVSRFSTPGDRKIPNWVFSDVNKYFILHNPLGFGKVLLDTLIRYGGDYLIGIVGIFGWLDYKLDFFVYLVFFSFFIYLCVKVFYKGLDFKISIWNYLVLLMSVITTVLLVFVSLYVTWTDLVYKYVLGPTGRYFLVVVPSFIILILSFLDVVNYKKYIKNIFIFICLSLVVYSVGKSVYSRFYDYSEWIGIEDKLGYNHMFCGSDRDNVTKLVVNDAIVKCHIGENKVYGISFKYRSPGKVGSYKLEIMDSECKEVLYSSYTNIHQKSFDGEFKKTFDPIFISDLCIRLSPFYVPDNEYLGVKGDGEKLSFKVFTTK